MADEVEVEVHSSAVRLPSHPAGDGGDVSISNDVNPKIFFMGIRNACNVSLLYAALKEQGYDILESLNEYGFHEVAGETWTTITKLTVKSGSTLNFADVQVLRYLANVNSTNGDERPVGERSTGGSLQELFLEDGVTFCVEGDGYEFMLMLYSTISPDTHLVQSAGTQDVWNCRYRCTSPNQIPEQIFEMASGTTCTLKRVRIPKNITEIGAQSFYYCTSLEELIFSDELTETDNSLTISGWAFGFCVNLGPAIRFPRNLTTIGQCAFYHTASLNQVFFPRTDQTVKNSSNSDYPLVEGDASGHISYNTHLGVYVPLDLVNQYRDEYLAGVCVDKPNGNDYVERIFPMVSPAKEFTTFSYFRPLDFSTIVGYYDDTKSLSAYAATSYDSENRELMMTPLGECPGETGVVLRRTEAVAGEMYPILDTQTAYSSLAAPSGNMLIAAVDGKSGIEQTDESTYTNFLLSDGVFHICAATGGSVSAYKAYLQLPELKTAATAKPLTVVWASGALPTAIDCAKVTSHADGPVYTPQGILVGHPGRGLYIKNGKKYVVK